MDIEAPICNDLFFCVNITAPIPRISFIDCFTNVSLISYGICQSVFYSRIHAYFDKWLRFIKICGQYFNFNIWFVFKFFNVLLFLVIHPLLIDVSIMSGVYFVSLQYYYKKKDKYNYHRSKELLLMCFILLFQWKIIRTR